MTLILYRDKKFKPESLAKISQAIKIIDEYDRQGFTLTLRQLYYQFVARDLIPNTQREYAKLSVLISDARLAGLISWNSIEDRTRFLRSLATWEKPQDILESAAKQYREDVWESQGCYAEVWVEKDALVGVIEPICNKLRMPFIACRGYMSQSEQWEAGRRFLRKMADGKDCFIFHLGDHDPSGLHMTQDNAERVRMFAEGRVHVRRLALNYDQVEEYNPPPNPAKMTDPRANDYVAEHGDTSWELDALEPSVISELIQDAYDSIIDLDKWDEAIEKEVTAKDRLRGLVKTLDRKK